MNSIPSIAAMKQELAKFTASKPKDHIRLNKERLQQQTEFMRKLGLIQTAVKEQAQQDLIESIRSTPDADITKFPELKTLAAEVSKQNKEPVEKSNDPLDPLRAALRRQKYKVRNLIGANPYKVKNYVQGDLNNSLVPLKLLQPHEVEFKDDTEFVEAYLRERAKEEAHKINLEKQRLKKFSLHLPRKGYQHDRSLADTQEDLLARLDERDALLETSAFPQTNQDHQASPKTADPFFRDFRPRKQSLPEAEKIMLNHNSSNGLQNLDISNHFKSRQRSMMVYTDGTNFLPHQIQTFLNRKPPKEAERERFDTSVQMASSEAHFRSVSSQNLEQMQSVSYLRQH